MVHSLMLSGVHPCHVQEDFANSDHFLKKIAFVGILKSWNVLVWHVQTWFFWKFFRGLDACMLYQWGVFETSQICHSFWQKTCFSVLLKLFRFNILGKWPWDLVSGLLLNSDCDKSLFYSWLSFVSSSLKCFFSLCNCNWAKSNCNCNK